MSGLPELPALPDTYFAADFVPDVPVYDAGQMRAYARAAVEQAIPCRSHECKRVRAEMQAEVERLRAAVERAGAWRPIESAPRDGTELLGWSAAVGAPLIIRWTAATEFMTDREIDQASSDDNDWMHDQDWFCADFIQGSRLEGDCAPTHWMPLPSAPARDAAGGG